MRWSTAAAVACVVAVLMAGCSTPTDGPDIAGSTSSSISTTAPSTSSSATTAPGVGIEPLVGEWYGHSRYLYVEQDGAFESSYRIYEDCDRHPAPCDRIEGHTIIDGGFINGRFTDGGAGTWHGTVDDAAETDFWPPGGTVTATLDGATDILTLHHDGASPDEDMTFCGDDAEVGACGA